MKRWTRAALFFFGLHLGRSPVLDAKISLLRLLNLLQVIIRVRRALCVEEEQPAPTRQISNVVRALHPRPEGRYHEQNSRPHEGRNRYRVGVEETNQPIPERESKEEADEEIQPWHMKRANEIIGNVLEWNLRFVRGQQSALAVEDAVT